MNETIEKNNIQELFRLMGLCLFSSQRIEFMLQALIGLFSRGFNDKQYKSITPSSFYEDSPSGKKLRKKTLGALTIKTKEFDIIDSERLEVYVKNRNYIVHNLWREKLNESLNGEKIDECIELCNSFIAETDKFERSFYGFLNVINTHLESQNIHIESEVKVKLKTFEKDLSEFFN